MSTALSTDRHKRPATIVAFRDALLPPKRSGGRKSLAAVLLVLVVAGAWFGYQQYQGGLEQQRVVDSRLQTGQDCFYSQDFKCAIENALVVRSLAPQNAKAAKLLNAAEEAQAEAQQEQLVNERMQAAETCFEAEDFDCARSRLRTLLDLVPGQAQAILMLQRVEQASARQLITTTLERAQDCVDAADIDCARQALAAAQEAGAQPGDLYPVQSQVDEMALELMAAARDREARIGLLLEEGRSCLQLNDFACVEDRVVAVLEQDSGNSAAAELRQAVAAAREQLRFREQTVAGFLQEAEDCFQRKNYSCTIAKSESALAIIPRHAAASAMIERADQAQKQAKMNISIE
ncbi:hypothetical protein [Kineobactrum salinum]|uniref:Tetratricopeptide repeat protein n=1 Tax=Kineobactrum salinum TaxID=2708301 RepID=A0A6C0U4M3_9GAMM|nr:hypothetical protein [Kineobactrum salinum]QIB67051.1 hypothetical protein G3T16_18290 [Kineobactrum salinum]